MIKKWREWSQNKPHVLPLAGIVFSLLLAALAQSASRSPRAAPADVEIDTYIPRGQVLVPISVHNSESVDSMFGSYGHVDLYAVEGSGQVASEPSVRNVKMLRAPRNPNQFGVLVPEERSASLVRSGREFAVVVLNRQGSGTKIEKNSSQKPKKVARRRIILEKE